MKLSFICFTAFTLTLLISGCGSTSKSLSKIDGEFIYPSMPILTESSFIWDDGDSEALNIVKIARPAGIGNSLRDYEDPTHASIGQIGGFSRLVDAGLGLASGSLFSIVQSESLTTGANTAVEFKPAIVELVDRSLVYENGKPSYKKVREYVANKIKKAIELDHPEIVWGGTYSLYNGVKRFDLALVIDSEKECLAVRRTITGDEDSPAFVTRNFAKIFVDGEDVERDFCSFGLHLSLPYELEGGKVAIVAELKSGAYFVETLIYHYDGYIVIPDFFSMNSSRAIRTEFAFVSKSGNKLLFQKQ
ncbi:hypothetical protein [Glaciecola sp. SC05]|uniref:hypothetical protein n=1 Tax=Glaciecola sp. SC05 TaxID=1987355 RepID=UPI0035281498